MAARFGFLMVLLEIPGIKLRLCSLILLFFYADRTTGARVLSVSHLAVSSLFLPAWFRAANLAGAMQATRTIGRFPAGVEPQIVVYGPDSQSFLSQPMNELQSLKVFLRIEALATSPLRWLHHARPFPDSDCFWMYTQ
jgi:hypothetical protein